MNFNIIQNKHLHIWVKVFKSEGVTEPAKMLSDLTLIDDLLVLQKSKSLLNKKRNFKQQIEARLEHELGFKTKNLNLKR